MYEDDELKMTKRILQLRSGDVLTTSVGTILPIILNYEHSTITNIVGTAIILSRDGVAMLDFQPRFRSVAHLVNVGALEVSCSTITESINNGWLQYDIQFVGLTPLSLSMDFDVIRSTIREDGVREIHEINLNLINMMSSRPAEIFEEKKEINDPIVDELNKLCDESDELLEEPITTLNADFHENLVGVIQILTKRYYQFKSHTDGRWSFFNPIKSNEKKIYPSYELCVMAAAEDLYKNMKED